MSEKSLLQKLKYGLRSDLNKALKNYEIAKRKENELRIKFCKNEKKPLNLESVLFLADENYRKAKRKEDKICDTLCKTEEALRKARHETARHLSIYNKLSEARRKTNSCLSFYENFRFEMRQHPSLLRRMFLEQKENAEVKKHLKYLIETKQAKTEHE